MVRTPCFHCRGHGFDPWLGKLRSRKPCDVAEKTHLNYREGDKAEMGHATEEMGVGTDSPWTEEPGGLQSMESQESDTT